VDVALIALCALAAGLLAQDANFDQLQYHYWYPWRLFHGGFSDPDLYGGRFQNPLAQVPFYLLASSLPPQIAQVLLGASAGVAAVLSRRIAARILPYTGGWQLAVSATAAGLGIVAAGFRSELGTSYSDVLLASLLLGGLLLVLRATPGATAVAGALAGAAVGLKYTAAPLAIAAVVALLILPPGRAQRSLLWLAGATGGWAVTGGAWAANLWQVYDSPVFPFWNSLFGSPWYPAQNLTDERYGVDGIAAWLTWPWDMATGAARVLDLPVADPRWLLLAAALIVAAVAHRRVGPEALAVIAFTVVGTAVWLAVFGVLRYAVPAELMAAVLIVWAIGLIADQQTTLITAVALITLAGLLTESAAGRRVPYGQSWFEVEPGPLLDVRPGDAVLVDGQYPGTFLLPGNLPGGVDVHVVQKDYTATPLRDWLVRELRQADRVWVVTGKGPRTQVDGVVGKIRYKQCRRIRSNVVNRQLCPVKL
jgi:hypothetical protein